MLLVVNVKNSNITLGGYNGVKLCFVAKMLSEKKYTADQYAIQLKEILALHSFSVDELDGAIIGSVVPELIMPLKDAILLLSGIKPLVLGPGLKTGLNILIDNPAELGADLVAAAVAALSLYPAPCIIYDFGTATTISVIDKGRNFIGGMISAGVSVSLEAITNNAALLTHVSMETPPSIIGKNSIHSLQAGIIYGTAAMVDDLSVRIEEEVGSKATVIVTGDLVNQIIFAVQRKVILNEYLVLEGLRIIYEKNRKAYHKMYRDCDK